ncbi:MAG: phosphate regulon sensor histidine kinase PhoR [Janthinobacterium lividum]
MNVIWARAWAVLGLIAAFALAVGFYFGPTLALSLIVVILLALLAFNVFQLQRLWRLLDAPAYGEIPSATGAWGEIYYRLHRLVKRFHLRFRDIENQHERFIEAIQASPNSVVMLDDNDQIEWCNAIAERHFGLDARRDVGQRLTHLIRRPEFISYLARMNYETELRMRGMGSDQQHVLAVQVFPYGDRRKLLLSQDITELVRTDDMRRDFVANVSHEIRTPLTVLAGFLETLRELPVSAAERSRYLDLMARQADRMQNIVKDLLTLARLEGDARPPTDAPIDMRELIEHLRLDAVALSGGAHQITVRAQASFDLVGARSEIESALGNLITNAVRYTPGGGSIGIEWIDEGSGGEGGRAVFCVTDTGIGIPPEHIPRLTERFYRVDRSRSRETGGTGLGLAIVKHVLHRHDAQLQVTSTPGQGSRFVVAFPAARLIPRMSRHPEAVLED